MRNIYKKMLMLAGLFNFLLCFCTQTMTITPATVTDLVASVSQFVVFFCNKADKVTKPTINKTLYHSCLTILGSLVYFS